MVLIHAMRDLTFTLVTRVRFRVRTEVINAVSLQEDAGSPTLSRHIASGCLHLTPSSGLGGNHDQRCEAYIGLWGLIGQRNM